MGLLLAASAPAAAAGDFAVANCLVAATNASLVAALLPAAAVVTPAPLLVYITSNVTLGVHPRLPAGGVVVRRPVVFVGLASLPTSLDFEMVVNQLNLTTSALANTTFVGLVLENLAPGDSVSSAMAAPFSITVTNNVWAVLYNRCVCGGAWWGSAHSQQQAAALAAAARHPCRPSPNTPVRTRPPTPAQVHSE